MELAWRALLSRTGAAKLQATRAEKTRKTMDVRIIFGCNQSVRSSSGIERSGLYEILLVNLQFFSTVFLDLIFGSEPLL